MAFIAHVLLPSLYPSFFFLSATCVDFRHRRRSVMSLFHAFELQPGRDYNLQLKPQYCFHLSTVSLPHGGKGRGTVYATVDGKSFSLATLDASGQVLHASLDLVFGKDQKVVFRVKGNAVIHCCGFQQEDDDASVSDMDDISSDGMDEELEDAEVPVKQMARNPAAKSSGAYDPTMEDEETANDDDEDDMDDMEDGEMDDDDEESSSSGEEEDVPPRRDASAKPKAQQREQKAQQQGPRQGQQSQKPSGKDIGKKRPRQQS
ncbi:unnamed protein product [Trypanosoma congolense IL3000]|uniref:WGS project CAEQ00000000 data, annotated contig 2277 n=1 Tax=Trypanosoma congolense (strain IL3000) TaxID=1068625 RepID=F9WCV3_TRYCI|nr:unnamed protein product [Trypanosoma congolense IL3000]